VVYGVGVDEYLFVSVEEHDDDVGGVVDALPA
jgi:hypothetical protein